MRRMTLQGGSPDRREVFLAVARPLSGVALRLDAPLAKREAGASELLRDRGAGRAVDGVVGTIFFEQTNSSYAEFVRLPRAVLALRHGSLPLSFRLGCLADCSPENPAQFNVSGWHARNL